MVSIDTFDRAPFVQFHRDRPGDIPVFSSRSVGTEFHPIQNLEHLPPSLIGLPADLKLTEIEGLLRSR